MMSLEGYTVDYAEPDNGKENSIEINRFIRGSIFRFGYA
jgi:hypothetical protein